MLRCGVSKSTAPRIVSHNSCYIYVASYYGMLWVLYNYTNQVVPPFECIDKWLYRKALNTFEYQ